MKKLLPWRFQLLAILIGISLMLIAIYFMQKNLNPSLSEGELMYEIEGGGKVATTTDGEDSMVIDIGGAVRAPGVYVVFTGARIADVVATAGGFSDDVDNKYLNQTLNLALPVSDSMKIYIPYQDESLEGVKTGFAESVVGNGVSINNAAVKELQTLSGIGEVRANAIVDGRPYSSVQELLDRGILTEKIFTNIKEEITL